ncbi:MAG: hypothetical protein V1922_03000 [bacterium]
MNDLTQGPVVCHTDDQKDWSRHTQKDMSEVFGIAVESYTRNEDALAAAKEKLLPDGTPYYRALIADYNTESNMSGGQLIAALVKAKLEGHPYVNDIMILSSSADRYSLTQRLKEAFLEQQLSSPEIDLYMDTVQIFDKTTERSLAELFVAIHTLYPKETERINREDMVHWAGFKMKPDGEVVKSSMYDLEDHIRDNVFKGIEGGSLKLPTIISEIAPFTQLREGRVNPPQTRR